jgi:hypothetical protein
MAEHSNKRSYPKHLALLAASFLPLGATVLVSDMASAQLLQLLQQPQVQHHAQVIRRTAARLNSGANQSDTGHASSGAQPCDRQDIGFGPSACGLQSG